jgi:hypothetical protein
MYELDEETMKMPFDEGTRLHGIVDCAYATDPIKRRSVLGFLGLINHAVIVYKSSLGMIIAISSTEGEFYAFVKGGKITLYLRSLLADLGYPCEGPTNIYADNTAVEFIVNDSRPTNRTRHVDVQFFAVQQWRDAGLINAKRLPGPINAADSMTKPTPYDTFQRHFRYALGQFRLDSDPVTEESKTTSTTDGLELGEGVRARAS